MVHGRQGGSASLRLPLFPTGAILSKTPITVDDEAESVLKLDPIISTLTLGLDSIPRSRLELGKVILEVMEGSLFVGQEAIVSASLVLEDGRRVVIRDSTELVVTTSNSSVVSVTQGTLLAEEVGVTSVNISWIICGAVLQSRVVEIEVILDLFRPVFIPEARRVVVPEDSTVGHSIAVVMATVQDSDEALTSDVQYRFQNGISHGGLFLLDPSTGAVTLNGPLDRETTDSFLLLIEATNGAQRRAEGDSEEAEQGGKEGEEGREGGSGSGSGSGSILGPDLPTVQSNVSIAVLMVRMYTDSTVQYSRVLYITHIHVHVYLILNVNMIVEYCMHYL